jgi:uncharacterized protein
MNMSKAGLAFAMAGVLAMATSVAGAPAPPPAKPSAAVAPPPAHPATYRTSFNCRRATSFADRTVCTDAKLAARDRRVYFLYQNALERDPSGEIQAQGRAAAGVRRACATVECVQRWYARREAALSQWAH